MFESVKISPSILSADFMNMERDIRLIEQGGSAFIHVDVMDGHFVPNITVGVPFVSRMKKITKIPLDVHLMITNPLEQVPWFLDAGSDWITLHLESFNNSISDLELAFSMIREAGSHPALALKPETPIESIEPFIDAVDMVLIMSVNPGFAGQSFISGTERRVERVVEMAKEAGVAPLIQVDGGIGTNTVEGVCAVGADVLVAGNAVFSSPDPQAAIKSLIRLGTAAQNRSYRNKGAQGDI